METQNKGLFAIILVIVKNFFSPKPDDVFTDVINSKKHVWVIFAGIYVLLSALAIMLILSGQIMGMIRSLFGTDFGREFLADIGGRNVINQVMREIMPYGGLFGSGLLLGIISFVVLSGCIKLLCNFKKLDVCFISVMNIVSLSLIIYNAAMLVAIIFSFFFIQFSIILIVVGAIGSLIMLYNGIQKVISLNSNSFWAFLIINALHIIIIALIAGRLLSAVLSGAVENIGTVIEDMLWGGGGGFDDFWW